MSEALTEGLSFDDWLRDLRIVAKEQERSADIVAETGPSCWFVFYEEGMTPADALAADDENGWLGDE